MMRASRASRWDRASIEPTRRGALRRCVHWALVVALAVGSATCLVIALWSPASPLDEPIPGAIDPRPEREPPSPAGFESAPISATHRLARVQHRPCGVGTRERDAGRGGPPARDVGAWVRAGSLRRSEPG
jgi:hypothetical protein